MNNKILIIYHKEDNDGVFSASIVKYALIHSNKYTDDDIDLYGTCYNELSKDFESGKLEKWALQYSSVIMTDISFNEVKAMKQMYDLFGNSFVWIDHHKPIIEESKKNNFGKANGIRETTRSAILLAYKYYFDVFDINYKDHSIPEILRVLSAWDSFSYEREGYELDYVRKVNIGVNFICKLNIDAAYNTIEKIFDDKDNFVQKLTADAYNQGNTIVEYENGVSAQLCKQSGDGEFKLIDDCGNIVRSAMALFVQGQSNSLMFDTVKDKYQNGIVFKRCPNGNWTISLYNTNKDDTFDCGAYLKKKYKGGGHIGAAGCTVSQAKFIKMLKIKVI